MKSFLQGYLKIILFTLLLSLVGGTEKLYAQFPYKLTISNQTYKPLTSGINLISEVWFNSDYFSLPVPFNMSLDTVHCQAPYIAGGSTFVTDTAMGHIISSFFLTDANLIDKGFIGSDLIFLSPIRYVVQGIPGARIFKLEIANAAFFNEIIYATSRDSVYMQIWLYESTNIVELRYGPSHISHSYNYFPNNGFPCIGYIQDVDSALNGTYHILSGDPLKPIVESITSVNGLLSTKPSGLNSFPPNGTVYRFSPGASAIDENESTPVAKTKVYPTQCKAEFMIDYATDEPYIKASYTLYSTNGKVQNTDILLPNTTTHVNTSILPPGVYVLQLQTSKGISREKIIKL